LYQFQLQKLKFKIMPEDLVAKAMAAAGGMNIAGDPVDPKPVDPVDPVDPKPVDPVNPKPVDPTDPVDPKQVDPVDPKPADPVDPVDPTKTIPNTPPASGDFGTLLSKETGGRFKSVDEIDTALAAAPEAAFANDQIAKLNDFVRQGGKLDDYFRTQVADYSAMSHQDAIAQSMQMFDNKGLDADEIKFLMTEKYGITKDSTEAQKRMAEINLKIDGETARQKLIENQDKWKTPVVSDQDSLAAEAVQLEKWQGTLSTSVDAAEKVVVKITDEVSFDFALDDVARTSIKEKFADPRKFFDRYKNADGTDNTEKFVREMAILENFDKIGPSLAAFAKSEGKDGILKDLNNPDFKAKGQGTPAGGSLSLAEQAQKAMGLR
jgi:hypothetical protein